MSTTSTTLHVHDAVGEERLGAGLLERVFRRFMARREAHARAIVDTHLSRLPDASLVELGYEPNDIRRIRSRAAIPANDWI